MAQQHEALYDIAKTQLARGEAGIKFGWPGAAEEARQSRARIAEIEDVEDR